MDTFAVSEVRKCSWGIASRKKCRSKIELLDTCAVSKRRKCPWGSASRQKYRIVIGNINKEK